jgi:hypothetical protein
MEFKAWLLVLVFVTLNLELQDLLIFLANFCCKFARFNIITIRV